MVSRSMAVGAGESTTTRPMTARVWRWKGTAADIVRIAETVSQVAEGPLAIEVIDAMGTRDFDSTSELERALAQPFRVLVLQAAGKGCKVTAIFDATGAHSPAAVTVLAEGSDSARAAAACGAVARAASAGAREPKGTPPAEVEKWATIGSFSLVAGPLIVLLVGESNPELLWLVSAMMIFGLVSVSFALGYEFLIPRVELLAAGATPRFHKFALWFAGAVGAALVAAAMSGLL